VAHESNNNKTTGSITLIDTFDGAKPRFLNRGKKRRSVSTLSIPRASDRGVEWVDLFVLFFIGCLLLNRKAEFTKGSSFGNSGTLKLLQHPPLSALSSQRVQLYRVKRYLCLYQKMLDLES
jgi:hypothetical protein